MALTEEDIYRIMSKVLDDQFFPVVEEIRKDLAEIKVELVEVKNRLTLVEDRLTRSEKEVKLLRNRVDDTILMIQEKYEELVGTMGHYFQASSLKYDQLSTRVGRLEVGVG